MRVALISTWDRACGVAEYSANLVAALDELGVVVDVFPLDVDELQYLTKPELDDYFAGIAAQVAEHEVAHVQHEFSFFQGAYKIGSSCERFERLHSLLARQMPVVTTFHTQPPTALDKGRRPLLVAQGLANQAIFKARVAHALNTADRAAVIAHSRTSRRRLFDAGIRPELIDVVPIGIPVGPALLTMDRLASRRERGIADEDTLLTSFGFLSEYKGVETLLDATALLPEHYRVVFVGGRHPLSDDLSSERLRENIIRRGLEDRVSITGYVSREEMQTWAQLTDLSVAPHLPTRVFASSAALAQAFSACRPVVASDIPAFVEVSHSAHCLELFPAGSPRGFADAIRRVAEDDHRRLALTAAVAEHVRTAGVLPTAKAHIRIYEDLLARQSRSRLRRFLARSKLLRQVWSARHPEVPFEAIEYRRIEAPGAISTEMAVDPLSTDPIGQEILHSRYPRDATNTLALTGLSARSSFIDVGAHIGTFAVPAAAAGCRVLAIEGSPDNVTLLNAASVRNGFGDRLMVVHAVAGESDGQARFVPKQAWGHVEFDPAREIDLERLMLPCVSVDALIEQYAITDVHTVKIDVEGSEARVLAGMSRLLAHDHAPLVLIESNAIALAPQGSSPEQLASMLEGHGYRCYLVDPTRRQHLQCVGPSDLQPEAVADWIAWKGHRSFQGWTIEHNPSPGGLIQRFEHAARSDHWPYRQHVVRELARATSEFVREPRIDAIRARLALDPVWQVRSASTE